MNAVNGVNPEISVVFGTAIVLIHQFWTMGRGVVVELTAHVNDHAWIYADKQLTAQGEIELNCENVSVPITETIGQSDDWPRPSDATHKLAGGCRIC